MSPEERFRELSAVVSAPVRRYVARRVPADDVDDVCSEIAVVLWRRLGDVPPEPLPWAYGIARKVVANQRRSAGRRGRLLDRLRTVVPAGEDPELPEVHAALSRLGEVDGEVVRLWAWEELAPREIAVVTGLSANAVSQRLSRARRRLADELGQDRRAAGHKQGENGGDRGR